MVAFPEMYLFDKEETDKFIESSHFKVFSKIIYDLLPEHFRSIPKEALEMLTLVVISDIVSYREIGKAAISSVESGVPISMYVVSCIICTTSSNNVFVNE